MGQIKVKDCLEFNENECTAYPNQWDTIKAMLRGKFIALSAYIKKVDKSHTSNLTEHLKTTKQKETDSPRRSRWQEIFKLRAEISKIEKKKTIQRINETKRWFFEKNQQDRQTLIPTNQKAEREHSD